MLNRFSELLGAQGPLVLGLLVALGAGLLLGLEREHHRARGAAPVMQAAGLRTFTIITLSGALAQGLDIPGLVAVGALAVAALVAIAYFRSSEKDISLSTEAALLAAYLIGVLCVQSPALGAPAAVLLAALLSARERLHRFARHWLREAELRDGLLLAALALIVLPLMPTEPLPWLAGLRASTMMGLLLLLLGLQAFGYLALRVLGAQTGLALAGLMSGLISSTATIAAMGHRTRAEPALFWACCAGAVMSTAATWLQVSLMLLALAPQAAQLFLPVSGVGMLAAGAAGLLLARRAKAAQGADGQAPGKSEAPAAADKGPLRLKEAALIAVTLSAVALLVSWAERQFGSAGLFSAVALAAIADAHAPVASLAGLSNAGQISHAQLAQGVMRAIACNSITRAITATLAGGR
ncbi:MAG: MgtC/SapB family protein, partial [Burkholderiaceae bacterium]|nr:MgtC/SapB family protein [Burkholderiaceae bacterium]